MILLKIIFYYNQINQKTNITYKNTIKKHILSKKVNKKNFFYN